MKLSKKTTSIALASIMILALMTPVMAAQDVPNDSTVFLTEEEKTTIANIPIYLTYIYTSDEDEIYNIQEGANQKLIEQTQEMSTYRAARSNVSEGVIITDDAYTVRCVSPEEKSAMFDNILYTSTLKNAQELMANGIIVKNINFFVVNSPENMTAPMAANDPSDPNYWLSTCTKLGTRNGYQFLYTESMTNVETGWVVPGNLTASLNWQSILQKSIKIAMDRYVKNTVYDTVSLTYDILSTMIDGYTPPLSISYSAGGGYVKAKVSGTLYQRTIFLEDKLNKFNGYAYYTYGGTQRLASAVKVDTKYPIKQNTSGTYEFAYKTGTSNIKTTSTPGYAGNTTLYDSILSCYNMNTYVTHVETIDVRQYMTTLLS